MDKIKKNDEVKKNDESLKTAGLVILKQEDINKLQVFNNELAEINKTINLLNKDAEICQLRLQLIQIEFNKQNESKIKLNQNLTILSKAIGEKYKIKPEEGVFNTKTGVFTKNK